MVEILRNMVGEGRADEVDFPVGDESGDGLVEGRSVIEGIGGRIDGPLQGRGERRRQVERERHVVRLMALDEATIAGRGGTGAAVDQ